MRAEWAAVLAIVATTGCGGNRSQDAEKRNDYSAAFKAVRDAKGLVLYEGLPHQFYEGKELEQEKRKREHFDLHDFSFYKPALDVASNDSQALAAVLGNLPDDFFAINVENDRSISPGEVELAVGRVDFEEVPAAFATEFDSSNLVVPIGGIGCAGGWN